MILSLIVLLTLISYSPSYAMFWNSIWINSLFGYWFVAIQPYSCLEFDGRTRHNKSICGLDLWFFYWFE